MPRIMGVDIPKNKKIERSLTYLFGVGLSWSKRLLKEANIDPTLRAEKLSEGEIAKIQNAIARFGLKVEGDARRQVTQDIKRLIAINSYRGTRHKKGLPVRGQNTHSNARTRKGPRKG